MIAPQFIQPQMRALLRTFTPEGATAEIEQQAAALAAIAAIDATPPPSRPALTALRPDRINLPEAPPPDPQQVNHIATLVALATYGAADAIRSALWPPDYPAAASIPLWQRMIAYSEAALERAYLQLNVGQPHTIDMFAALDKAAALGRLYANTPLAPPDLLGARPPRYLYVGLALVSGHAPPLVGEHEARIDEIAPALTPMWATLPTPNPLTPYRAVLRGRTHALSVIWKHSTLKAKKR